jgi:hypothetical protein
MARKPRKPTNVIPFPMPAPPPAPESFLSDEARDALHVAIFQFGMTVGFAWVREHVTEGDKYARLSDLPDDALCRAAAKALELATYRSMAAG